MELEFSLAVCVVIVDVFDFDNWWYEFDDLDDFAESIGVNNVENLLVEDLNEVGISLIFNFGISAIDSLDLKAHLLN